MFASPRSKSINKTLFLYLRKIIAKFAAMFDFPTPPLPLVTAIVLTLENPVVLFCLSPASFNTSATFAYTIYSFSLGNFYTQLYYSQRFNPNARCDLFKGQYWHLSQFY